MLQASSGASAYYHGGANVYGKFGYKLFPDSLKNAIRDSHPHENISNGRKGNYESESNYHESKVRHTKIIAAHVREYLGVDWCIAESGATGPTFAPPDWKNGFTAICVCGPMHVCEVVIVKSEHADREKNMWLFAAAGIRLLAKCLRENQPAVHRL